MRHGYRTSVRAAAAVCATTVVTIAAVTVVTGGDDVGAALLAGGLLVMGHALRHRAREALVYHPLHDGRSMGARLGRAGEVTRETRPEETP
jgi:hypothetical protein